MSDLKTNAAAIEAYFVTTIEAAMATGGALEDVRAFWPRGRAMGNERMPLIARESRSIENDAFTTNRDESFLEITYAIVEANVDRHVGTGTVEDLGLELAGVFIEATDWPDAVAELDVSRIEDSPDETGSLAISLVTFRTRFEHLRS